MNPTKPERYDFIDSLRGLAAISVLYLHSAHELLQNNLVGAGVEHFIMTAMTAVVDVGKVGIVVFFAISGFIIPFALTKKNSTTTEFAINRIFRLYPAYWLSIIIAVFVLYHLRGLSAPTSTILVNFTMLQQFIRQPNIMDLYWTLQIELIFYMLCIVLFLVGFLEDNRKLFSISIGLLCIALGMAAARYATHMKLPVAVPLALSIMFWGSMLKHFHIDRDNNAKMLSHLMIGIYAIIIPVVCLLAYNFDAGFDETWYRYTASYFTAIMLFYIFTGRVRIRGRLWLWLGKISYSVYLFHPIFIALTFMYIIPLDPHSPISHIYIAVILGMTLLFCHYTYSYVEAPCIAIGRVLNKHLHTKVANASGISVKS